MQETRGTPAMLEVECRRLDRRSEKGVATYFLLPSQSAARSYVASASKGAIPSVFDKADVKALVMEKFGQFEHCTHVALQRVWDTKGMEF
ncbi:hypothetical protein NL676_003778 [Syzygium grande]|nr:hypothetical protein NL676_003778 [Syzygium grande]